ncbi:MAG: hypothetical protein QOE90_918 [Thermoplasmata archaeon]|jgi:hypothetical protein|nr:hypothetical protein [Thermoplasmata archaeon]
MGWRLVALLVAALLLPSASAAPIATAALTLPAASTVTGSPLAIWANNTNAPSTFELHVPLLHVHAVQRDYTRASTIRVYGHETFPTFDLHNATVTLDAAPPGDSAWIGIYPDARAHLAFTLTDASTVTAAGPERIGRGGTVTPDADPYYQRDLDGPHLDATGPGALAYAGPAVVKITGGIVRIHANENDTTWQTQPYDQDPALTHQGTEAHLVLTFDTGSFTLATSAPLVVALASAHATWTGTAYAGPIPLDASGATLTSALIAGSPAAYLIPDTPGAATLTQIATGAPALAPWAITGALALLLALTLGALARARRDRLRDSWIVAQAAYAARDDALARRALVRALQKDPRLALDVEGTFPSLSTDPRIQRALERAYQRDGRL